MSDLYSIFIVSESTSKETFWCFLSKPEELDVGSKIYANSSARLTIAPNSAPEAVFGIPIQYQLGAKSVNKAVGLNIKVSTSQTKDVQLGEVWKSTFYDGEEHEAPDLEKVDGEKAKENNLIYKDNHFDPDKVIENSWYPSQSYGMKTDAGFIGMTWEARPGKKVTILPKTEFFITTADYTANTLADFTTISDDVAIVKLSDFSGKAATVTYKSDGTWNVTSGRPRSLVGSV